MSAAISGGCAECPPHSFRGGVFDIRPFVAIRHSPFARAGSMLCEQRFFDTDTFLRRRVATRCRRRLATRAFSVSLQLDCALAICNASQLWRMANGEWRKANSEERTIGSHHEAARFLDRIWLRHCRSYRNWVDGGTITARRLQPHFASGKKYPD